MSCMATINGLRVIELPPHSSHFTQPLDANLFGTLKMAYRSVRTGNERPKYEAKLMRCYTAWYRTCLPNNVIASWQKTGIDFRFPILNEFVAVLNIAKLLELMKAYCCDYDDEFEISDWDKPEDE